MRTGFLLGAWFTAALFATDSRAGRPDFSGTWVLDLGKSENPDQKLRSLVWVITDKDEMLTQVKQIETTDGKHKTLLIACGTTGAECKLADGSATVSMWYNGPLLIQLEKRGEAVIKRKMSLSPNGRVLEVDVTSIMPKERREKLVFARKD